MTDSIQVSTTIDVPAEEIWAGLTRPNLIKTNFFGATVDTDWKPGSRISWTGEYKGKRFQDKGQIKEFEPNKRLSMTHWSPLSGLADSPANYHIVVYDLEPNGGPRNTKLTITQRNLTGSMLHTSKKNWEGVLEGIERTVMRNDGDR